MLLFQVITLYLDQVRLSSDKLQYKSKPCRLTKVETLHEHALPFYWY